MKKFIHTVELAKTIQKSKPALQNRSIKCFHTKKEVSNPTIKNTLANFFCNCGSGNLTLVKNERADASYKYAIYCADCGEYLGNIDWRDKFKKTKK